MSKPSDDDLISISAAANVIGINKSTLSRQVTSGTVRSHDGKVRLAEVIADRTARLDPARATRSATLHAADATRGGDAPPVLPAGMEALARFDDPFLAGAAFGMLALTYRAGVIASTVALECGAPLPVAYAMHGLAVMMTVEHAEKTLMKELTYNPAAIAEMDWEAVAAARGLVFDRAACEAHLAAVNADVEG